MSKVSVIMPAFNAANYIEEAIQSIINQTYKNWELIVVDDGSTDRTSELFKTFAATDSRIKYYYQSNSKQGYARNTGIKNSEADLIAFLDADDLWLPTKLAVQLAVFNESDCDLLFSNAYIFESKFEINSFNSFSKNFQVIASEYQNEAGLSEFLYYNRIPTLTALFKKKIIHNAGFFSSRAVCEDYEMWLKLLVMGYKFKSISTPLAAYRVHQNSSTSNDKLAIDDCIDVIHSLEVSTSQHKFNHLFSRFLKVWYERKLNMICNSKQLASFLKKLASQKRTGFKVLVISLLNFNNQYILSLNKRLLTRMLNE